MNKGRQAATSSSLEEFFVLSAPIGNPKDLSLRAVEVLQDTNAIVVESFCCAKKLLDELRIPTEDKTFWELTRKNEARVASELSETLRTGFRRAVLMTDGGAPTLDDPGQHLLENIRAFPSIKVTFLPGASSVLAALVQSGFKASPFHHAGFLPVHEERRQQALRRLREIGETTTLFESPHRLHHLTKSLLRVFGPNHLIAICFDLSTPSESLLKGTIEFVAAQIDKEAAKRLFVLVVEGRKPEQPPYNRRATSRM